MSKTFDYMFVGLGNPGKKYQLNRHNIGWLALYEFVLRHEKDFNASKKYPAYQSKLNINSKDILCILPTTYMNNSGEAVRPIAKKHKIPPENIIVLVDEYNFPLGKIHLKKGGSAGGHNGLKSLIFNLDTEDFYRFRLGIGNDFGHGGLVNYVLSDFSEEEWKEVKTPILNTVKGLNFIIDEGPQQAMSMINSEELFNKEN